VSGGTQNRSPPRDFRGGGRGRGQSRKRDRESPPNQTGMLSLLGVLDTTNVTNHQRRNPFSISCSMIVSRPPQVGRPQETELVQRARAALDTQANGIDLISRKYLEQLVDIDSYKCRDCSQHPILVCSPITPNTCISCTDKIKITILLPSIHKKDELRVLNLTCVIADLDDRFADVVIGSETIEKEGLLNSKWIRTSLETSTTDNTLENTETENVAAQHGEQPIDSGPTWLTGEESVILGGLLGENYMSKEEVWGPQEPEPDGTENIETISDLLPDPGGPSPIRGGGDDDLRVAAEYLKQYSIYADGSGISSVGQFSRNRRRFLSSSSLWRKNPIGMKPPVKGERDHNHRIGIVKLRGS